MLRFTALFLLLFSLQAPAYNIDKNQISVSGLSSGAYMAGQVHVAFSDTIMGVGIISGGPFYCAKNSSYTAQTDCMGAPMGPTPHEDSVEEAQRLQKTGSIAPLSNIAKARVYVLSGKNDEVVVRAVSNEAVAFYKALGVKAAQIHYVTNLAVGHSFPTVDYGNECSAPRVSPFISRCNYDTAGELLNHIYGTLKAPVKQVKENLVSLSQKKYTRINPADISLADKAFAYVPTACATGVKCRLHLAFHGCKQTTDDIADQFYVNTGYNEWAESNNIIVVYPQAVRTSMFGGNPNGCWDWWGYTDEHYHAQDGPQMKLISRMIDDLSLSTTRLRK